MFSGEKILLSFLLVSIIGASGYFVFSKLHEDILGPQPSPSPSPSSLDFLFNANSASTTIGQNLGYAISGLTGQAVNTPSSTPSELPLEKTKRLDKFPGILKPEVLQKKVAVIQTEKGVIAFEIYPEATMAASNFLILASNGFYNGLTFHRVEPGFVIQGGDPDGNGTGGPGYQFKDEPFYGEYAKGTVAYANAGPDTNGSQFFIMLEDKLDLLKKYVIFGKVISGMDVVGKIAVGDVMQKVTIQNLK